MFSSMNITTIPSVLYHLKCLKPFSLSMEAFLTTSINDLYTLIIHNYDPSLTTFQPTWFIPLIFPYIESNWSKHVNCLQIGNFNCINAFGIFYPYFSTVIFHEFSWGYFSFRFFFPFLSLFDFGWKNCCLKLLYHDWIFIQTFIPKLFFLCREVRNFFSWQLKELNLKANKQQLFLKNFLFYGLSPS